MCSDFFPCADVSLVDLYAPGLGQSQMIDEMFVLLSRRLAVELKFQTQLMELLVREGL